MADERVYEDRLIFEKMLRAEMKKGEIARRLHIQKNTVTNEIKRGRYLLRNSDYTEEYRYLAELAEKHYQENVKMRGMQLKIANDYEYAQYLENRIADDDFSPSAVLRELEATGKDKEYKTKICVTTLYSYIDKGVFLKLTKDIPVKGKRKHKYHKVKRQKRASAEKSITERPKEVEDKETFGNWEAEDISNIEHWINHYPRKIFGFHTSAELFDKEVAMIT